MVWNWKYQVWPPPNIACLQIYPGDAIYTAVVILSLRASAGPVKPDNFVRNGGEGCDQLTMSVKYTWCYVKCYIPKALSKQWFD